MNSFESLRLIQPTSVLVLSSIFALLIACFAFWGWRRSGFAKAHGGLECMRMCIVVVIAILLNQPEWVRESRPDEKPTIAVLWDDSASMQTVDVVADPNQQNAVSRSTAIQPLTEASRWSQLDETLAVVIEPFAKPSPGRGSDLHTPLRELADDANSLVGVVVISDGDWNEGPPPVDAATRLRLRDIPIFSVVAGSTRRLPDLHLVSVDLPTFAVVGKPLRIPFTIESSLPRETVSKVTLTISGGETMTRDVRVAAMGRTTDAFLWKPSEIGDFGIDVVLAKHPAERIETNNQLAGRIAVRQEKLKVLVVESYPRWEYRYLRNALSRDPGVEVNCLLFHPGLDKAGGGSKDYIKTFPDEIEELSVYDVVFLGDVGVDDDQLTPRQCELIRGLVEQQASGLVFLPGYQGRQFSLLETDLGDLYPVVMDPLQPGGWGDRTAGQFELTERGRRSLLTKLADTRDDNVQVWESLPGFQWYAPVIRARAGSDVLAVHGETSNQFGRLPLLATRTAGAGKVLFMGTDGAWRWRKGVEDKYHYRFWGQVVRWMAYQRNMAKGESMRLFFTPDQPVMRQTMTLTAHVMDAGGEPLQSGNVITRITTPLGKIETVRLVPAGGQWGVFGGSYTPQTPGEHSIALACKQTTAQLETTFFVQGQALEQIGKPARPEVMQELALVTRGKTVEPAEIDEIISRLGDLPLPAPVVSRVELWSHPATAILLVFLMGVFWTLRKSLGLI